MIVGTKNENGLVVYVTHVWVYVTHVRVYVTHVRVSITHVRVYVILTVLPHIRACLQIKRPVTFFALYRSRLGRCSVSMGRASHSPPLKTV
jgi:hypothetical protein